MAAFAFELPVRPEQFVARESGVVENSAAPGIQLVA
jgi:hypothetical protein